MNGLRWKVKEKAKAVRKLKTAISIDSPEMKLWFAVLERAIFDIGEKDKVIPYKKYAWNSDHFFFNPNRKREEIQETLELNEEFLFSTLREHNVWPLPKDHYDINNYI